MHDNDIIHRDIKPENILLHEVDIMLFRKSPKFVILAGQSIPLCSETHAAEPHYIHLPKLCKSSSTTIKWMSGISVLFG